MAVTLYSSVKQFVTSMSKWIASGGGLVDQNTANIRSLTCVSCHNNKATDEVKGGCSTCNKGRNMAVTLLRKTVIKNNSTPRDGQLKVCALCGCDLKTKIWFPNEALLTKEDSNAYPSFCWAKKIEDGTQV